MWGKLKKNRWIEWIAALCVIIGIVFFVVYVCKLSSSDYSISGRIEDRDIERTGQIGDFFGGIVGSVWALAGVLLYFSALKMQAKELHHQKEEMSENKKLLSQQQFETTFFNLLKAQSDIKNSAKGWFYTIEQNGTSYKRVSKEFTSSDYFLRIIYEMRCLYAIYNSSECQKWDEQYVEHLLEEFFEYYSCCEDYESAQTIRLERDKLYFNLNQYNLTSYYGVKESTVRLAKSKDTEKMMCQCIYGHLYIKQHNSLGHYCRHIYNIVKFLDQEKRDCLDRLNDSFPEGNPIRDAELKKLELRFKGYISFIDSVLSTSELFILFYNAFLFPKAKKLYVDYHLFDNLRIEDLIKKRHAKLMEGATLKTHNEIFDDILKEIQQSV